MVSTLEFINQRWGYLFQYEYAILDKSLLASTPFIEFNLIKK